MALVPAHKNKDVHTYSSKPLLTCNTPLQLQVAICASSAACLEGDDNQHHRRLVMLIVITSQASSTNCYLKLRVAIQVVQKVGREHVVEVVKGEIDDMAPELYHHLLL